MPLIVAETLVLTQSPVLTHIVGDVGTFLNETVRLFVNDFVPTGVSTLDDFVEATFLGYEGKAPSFDGATEQNSDGSVSLLSDELLEYVGPSDASGQVIYGYYITDDPATVLYAAYRFPTPVGMSTPADVLTLLPGLRIPAIG